MRHGIGHSCLVTSNEQGVTDKPVKVQDFRENYPSFKRNLEGEVSKTDHLRDSTPKLEKYKAVNFFTCVGR
jgi:hypothetical protein